MADDSELQKLCHNILNLENNVRFTAFIDESGRIIAVAYRKNMVPLLNTSEIERYAVQTTIRAMTRQMFESKLGKYRYSIGVYENVIQVTIPIIDNTMHKLYLSLSLDPVGLDYLSLIENAIMPAITKSEMTVL